ncbi:hypothetical protein [Nonomuraea roseola]|uniref:DUF222 domain-containing protein n=1 Tax=Nonomuraea roseola TaxID=46179 RepID=A0ABV5QF83_9ACTN
MPWRDLGPADQEHLHTELRELAIQLSDLITDSDHTEQHTGSPDQRAVGLLAMLRATHLIHAALDTLMSQLAWEAGQTGRVGYPQLGDAVGISRQSARTRWPHALPATTRRRGRRRSATPPASDIPKTADPTTPSPTRESLRDSAATRSDTRG